jgi:hypothetical protein
MELSVESSVESSVPTLEVVSSVKTQEDINLLEKIQFSIEKMTQYHQVQILKLLQTIEENVVFNENRYGVFINMCDLSDATLKQLQEYIEYVLKQEKQLDCIENQKNEYRATYFKS